MPDTTGRVQVLLLADTHGQLHPEILALAERADWVVHAGDIGTPEILHRLRGHRRQLAAVHGNNDTPRAWSAQGHDALAFPEAVAEIALPGGVLCAEHGHRANPATRRHAVLRARYPHARLVIYGHSHRQVIDDSATPWVANPGAAGRSRTFGGSGCLLLNASRSAWHLQAFQFSLGDWKK